MNSIAPFCRYHVNSAIGGGWRLRKEDGFRALRTYRLKIDAVVQGRKLARRDGVELVIHRKGGGIQAWANYGGAPLRAKGKHR